MLLCRRPKKQQIRKKCPGNNKIEISYLPLKAFSDVEILFAIRYRYSSLFNNLINYKAYGLPAIIKYKLLNRMLFWQNKTKSTSNYNSFQNSNRKDRKTRFTVSVVLYSREMISVMCCTQDLFHRLLNVLECYKTSLRRRLSTSQQQNRYSYVPHLGILAFLMNFPEFSISTARRLRQCATLGDSFICG